MQGSVTGPQAIISTHVHITVRVPRKKLGQAAGRHLRSEPQVFVLQVSPPLLGSMPSTEDPFLALQGRQVLQGREGQSLESHLVLNATFNDLLAMRGPSTSWSSRPLPNSGQSSISRQFILKGASSCLPSIHRWASGQSACGHVVQTDRDKVT